MLEDLDVDEIRIEAVASSGLQSYLPAVEAAVLAHAALNAPPDPHAAAVAGPVWTGAVDSLIIPALRQIAREHVDQALLVQGDRGVIDESIAGTLAHVRSYLLTLPDEVQGALLRIVAAGHLDPATVPAEISRYLSWDATDRWKSRAQTIATTTTTAVVNGALYAVGLLSARLGPSEQKVWQSQRDSHVRPTHRAADGQTRDMWQPFTVGPEHARLLYPGDPLCRVPQETVGCRCRLAFTHRGKPVSGLILPTPESAPLPPL